MKKTLNTIAVLTALGISGSAFAYSISYTDRDGEFFTLSQDNPDQTQYFGTSLSDFGDPAIFSQSINLSLPVPLAQTINGWRMDLAAAVNSFDCPWCVIELQEHSSYTTTDTGKIFFNVSNMDLNAGTAGDTFFDVDTYMDTSVGLTIWYTAQDIGSPSDLAAVSPVPLPASAWLFASGLMGITAISRRRDLVKSKTPMDRVKF